MDGDEITDKDVTRIGKLASRALALTALLGSVAPRYHSGRTSRNTSMPLHSC
jgi:hypothetical protein